MQIKVWIQPGHRVKWLIWASQAQATSSCGSAHHHHHHVSQSATTSSIWIIISAIVIVIQPSAVSMVKTVRSRAHTQGLVSSHEYFSLNSAWKTEEEKKTSPAVAHRQWPNTKSHFYCCGFEFTLHTFIFMCQNILNLNANAQTKKVVSTIVSCFNPRGLF